MINTDNRPTHAFARSIEGVIAKGHGVASGRASNEYPQGSISMQAKHFKAAGINLDGFFMGTLNVSISPKTFELARPYAFVKQVTWAPGITENFYFCRVEIESDGNRTAGFLYVPDPVTKTQHPDNPSHLQLLALKIDGVAYGSRVVVHYDPREFFIK